MGVSINSHIPSYHLQSIIVHQQGPMEVIKFCKECVLSEDEEPCDVPANLFDDDDDVLPSGGLHP